MDSNLDWTTGILPPPHGTRGIPVLRISGGNGRSDLADHPFLTSVDPKALEAEERHFDPNHKKYTVISPKTLR